MIPVPYADKLLNPVAVHRLTDDQQGCNSSPDLIRKLFNQSGQTSSNRIVEFAEDGAFPNFREFQHLLDQLTNKSGIELVVLYQQGNRF